MTGRSRILYVWDADYPWDIRAEKTCSALTAGGYDVHLVARNKAWRPLVERRPEALVHRMRPWRWLGHRLDVAMGFPAFFSPRWWSLIYRTALTASVQAILVRDLPLCPTAIVVGRQTGIPVLLDMAEHYPAMLRELWAAGRRRPFDVVLRNPAAADVVERWCVKRVDRIWVVARESADRLVRLGVRGDRIDLVLNTPNLRPDPTPAPGDSRIRNQRLTVVYLGLLQVERGIMELVDAAAILRDRGTPALIRIIGDGRDAALVRAHAVALGLTETEVEFTGYIENERALRLVAESDIGVSPLRRGGLHDSCLPNKLFDYMAAGLPVITSSSVPSARVVRETGAGEVFEAGNAQDLAKAIERLLPATARVQCAEAARRAVSEQYNWSWDAERIRDSIQRAINSRSV